MSLNLRCNLHLFKKVDGFFELKTVGEAPTVNFKKTYFTKGKGGECTKGHSPGQSQRRLQRKVDGFSMA
jgi:hypothetical protein